MPGHTLCSMHELDFIKVINKGDGDMALTFKFESEQVRCVYTDAPEFAMPEHKGKVFAVIGPFDSFTDKTKLQDALRTLLRGWNIQSDSE